MTSLPRPIPPDRPRSEPASPRVVRICEAPAGPGGRFLFLDPHGEEREARLERHEAACMLRDAPSALLRMRRVRNRASPAIRIPDSIVKQPSVFVLAAGIPRGAQFVFSLAPSKEGAERRPAQRVRALARSTGPALRSAGLALRRSTAAFSILGAPLPFDPVPVVLPPTRKGQGTSPGRRNAPGGRSKDSRDRGVRRPRAQAPLPLHIWLACADAPLSEGGCAHSSGLKIIVQIKIFIKGGSHGANIGPVVGGERIVRVTLSPFNSSPASP